MAHRWGDAPIQSATLNLFAPRGSLRQLDMDYTHGSTMNEIRRGVEVPYAPMDRTFRRLTLLVSNSTNNSNVVPVLPPAVDDWTNIVTITVTRGDEPSPGNHSWTFECEDGTYFEGVSPDFRR